MKVTLDFFAPVDCSELGGCFRGSADPTQNRAIRGKLRLFLLLNRKARVIILDAEMPRQDPEEIPS